MTATYRQTARQHEDATAALINHAVELMNKRFPEVYAEIEAHLIAQLADGEFAGVCPDKVRISATEQLAQAAYVAMHSAGEGLGYDRDREQYGEKPHACDRCAGVGELDVRVV